MDWWNVSIYAVIPIVSVVSVFMFNRKLLWAAPFISFILAVVVTGIGVGFNEFFENHYQLLWLTMVVNFVIATIFTAVFFSISKLRSQRK